MGVTGHRRGIARKGSLGATLAALILTVLVLVPSHAQATTLPTTISSNTTLTTAGSPYTGGNVTVDSGVTLTVDPGVVVKVGLLTINGDLDVNGTGGSPAVFTDSTDSAASSWSGISVNGSASIDHAEIRWAPIGIQGASGTAPSITNSTITDTWQQAVYLNNPTSSAVVSGNTISGNEAGILLDAGSAEVSDNEISDCDDSYGIYYRSQTWAATGSVRIHDNTVDGCGHPSLNPSENGLAAISVFGNTTQNVTVTGSTVGGNAITNSPGIALNYYVDSYQSSIPANLDDNDLSGNGSDAIYFAGQLTGSATWQDRGQPLVPRAGYNFAVASGADLTIEHGATVKPGGFFYVYGNLEVDGTKADPVIFTAIDNDAVGGDTNGDGNATSTGPGHWYGLRYESGSTGHVDQALISYGGTSFAAAVTLCACSSNQPWIRHSKISHTPQDGIYISGDPGSTADSGPVASFIAYRFIDSSGYAITKTGSAIVSSPYGDYGCVSGSALQGCGARIGVKIDPLPLSIDVDPEALCFGSRRKGCASGADPVSLATGSLSYEHTDLSLSNKSPQPLAFTRYYNSADDSDAGLGPGWSHSAIMFAGEQPDGDVVIRNFDGSQTVFGKVGGDYEAPPGVNDILTKPSGHYLLTTQDRTAYAFDTSARIDSITDDHGLVTDYAYDTNGRLATIADPSSQTLTFSYNGSNHITRVTDSAGRHVDFTYSSGNLATVTDALGEVTTYGYDSGHRLTTITDPRSVTFLTNTYDGQGRVTAQEDGNGNVWDLDYGSGETTVTEPEGGELTYEFNADLQTTAVTDQLGHTTSYSYDAAGNVDQVTAPGGAVTSYDYDSAGNLTQATDPEGGERTYAYDASNRLTDFTDERGKAWAYTWDTDNDLTDIDGPGAADWQIAYNASGQPTTVTDPNSTDTTYVYGTHGVLSSVTDPLSHTTSLGYDSYNQLTSVTRPGLDPETYTRNALGDLLSQTTPEGNETEYGYDENGALTSVTDPALNEWTIERDDMERPITYTDPLLHESTITYDANLNPISVTDRNSHTTSYAYDLANQLTEIDAPATGTWQFDYDARGNRDTVIDPRANETDYVYDLADRLIEADEPESTASTYTYDDAGNLASLTDPNSHTTSFTYDDLGRLSEIAQPLSKTTTFDYDPAGNLIERATAEDTLTMAYDDADRLESISDGVATLRSFGYGAANRLISATDAQAAELQLGYDDDGNLTSVDDDRGQSVSRSFDSRGNLTEQTDGRGTIDYAYDELNRITELTDPSTDVLEFGYDPEGNLTGVDLPNGIVTTNTYDAADRLTGTASVNGMTTLQDFSYVYDDTGNRTSVTDRNSDTTTYAYDDLNRLTEFDPPAAAAISYGYDDAGNRTSADGVTYAFNALNQLVSDSAGNDYSYDGAGRLVGVDDGVVAVSYDYDGLDQLTGVDDGTNALSYSYDGLGRRSERDDGSAIETAHYGDASDSPILDTDSGGVLRTWIQGPVGSTMTAASTMALAEQTNGANIQFPLADAHGDVTTVADDLGGVASRQEFDPWGSQLSGPGLPMGWLGAYERRSDIQAGASGPDVGTGLVQMGVRTYASGLGRFTSEDPVLGLIGHGQSTSRSEYAFGNPTTGYDLQGQMPSNNGSGMGFQFGPNDLTGIRNPANVPSSVNPCDQPGAAPVCSSRSLLRFGRTPAYSGRSFGGSSASFCDGGFTNIVCDIAGAVPQFVAGCLPGGATGAQVVIEHGGYIPLPQGRSIGVVGGAVAGCVGGGAGNVAFGVNPITRR